MTKEIQFPTDEWIDSYIDKHECSIMEAEQAWWDKQIDKGNPTPFDLSSEQQKAVKENTRSRTHKTVDPAGKTKERKRKENPAKSYIISKTQEMLQACNEHAIHDITVTNAERAIDFVMDGVSYTLTLIAHRPAKG